MELLVTVIRQNCRFRLLGNAQDERIPAADGSRGRRDQFVVFDCLVESRNFLRIDAVTERGVDNDRDCSLGMFFEEGHDSLVQLFETRLRSALGGDVRTVDDDVLDHDPFSQARMTFTSSDRPTICL